MRFKINLLFTLALILFLTACQKETTAPVAVNQETATLPVKIKTVAASRVLTQILEYPGTVVPEQEIKIVAKTNGTAVAVNFDLGDQVSAGQLLVKIDDPQNGNLTEKGFSNDQIKQAEFAVKQAETALQLARSNYANLSASSQKDLAQLQITQNQAQTGQANLEITTVEALKTAELNSESAKIATENARLSLENRRTLNNQNLSDSENNAKTTTVTLIDQCNVSLNALNALFIFDENIVGPISYKDNLGALNLQTFTSAQKTYETAREQLLKNQSTNFANVEEQISATQTLIELTKQAVDASYVLLENTVTSANLPATFNAGTSLTSLKTAVSGYQTQINTALSQIKTSAALTATKSQLDTAEIAFQNAQVALSNLISTRLITAPVGGVVTKKMLATGDAVSAGQLLALINATNAVKIQFYIDQSYLPLLQMGDSINFQDNADQSVAGVISAIAPQADALTKRFLVEIYPDSKAVLKSGALVTVNLTLKQKPSQPDAIFIPTSALQIGQTETSLFTVQAQKIQKNPVTILHVLGESVEVKTNLPDTAQIVIEGNKLVKEGDTVDIQ